MPQIVIFTDLDGSLLDEATYSFEAAREALSALRDRTIPLILASSKTRAEIESLRARLHNTDPFVVENGSALYVPPGLFDHSIEGATIHNGYQVIELGTAYPSLRKALQEIRQALGCDVRGFGDMSAEEIAGRTGLSHTEAGLAKQREYDEPFIIEGLENPALLVNEVHRQAEARGLRCTKGGRFFHLMGNSDKGRACQLLIDCYRRQQNWTGNALATIGIGDSLNDLPMLAVVDYPVLVQRSDGSHDPEVSLPNLTFAPGIGPVGWNRAVLDLLSRA